MASGRTFSWHTLDGRVFPLDRDLGYWVLKGVTGLGKPIYVTDLEPRANADGVIHRGSRADSRQIFLPLEISGSSRAELVSRLQTFGEAMNPRAGAGYLYITDAGRTYRIPCIYKGGMEGDEGPLSGETDGHWQRTGLVLSAIDPYFEDPTIQVEEWGYSGAVPFFPIPPVKLNPQQVLSTVSQPATNNFILNPSAETNSLNWTNTLLGTTPCTITRSPVMARKGDWCFRIESSAVSTGTVAAPDMASSNAPFIIGNTYTFHAWVYIPSGQSSVRAEAFFVASGVSVTSRDEWVWVRVTWVATSTGDRPILYQNDQDNSIPMGAYYYVDAACVSEGIITSPDQYVDGDQLYCHWIGTPHASQSFQDPIYAPSIVRNEGTVEAFPIWRIIGPGSLVELVNERTGRTFKWASSVSLGSGTVLTIDTQRKVVYTMNGDLEESQYQDVEEDDFWPLEPGDNTVRLAMAGASAGSKIILTWFRQYESIVG